MVLTPTDVESISRSLTRWEIAEYVATGLVTLACAGEYIADFTDWFTRGEKEKKERLAKISTLILIAALAFELVCVVRTNELSGRVIGSLGDEAMAADDKARKAIADSDVATHQAGQAKDKAGAAEEVALKASGSASAALTTASGARKEADSFEREIVSAKEEAAKAEAHLAEALQRAAAAEKRADDVSEKLADRTLSDRQQQAIAKKLKGFSGQEYKVVAYWDSTESLGIANLIHRALKAANWIYLPPPLTGIALMGGIVGIQVWHHPDSDESTKGAARALIDALNFEGITAFEKVENPTNNPKHNDINLSVGSKR
jgi:hypothetical protein